MAGEGTVQRLSNHMFLARSNRLYEPSDGTHVLILIPRYGFVTNVWAYIDNAYVGGSPSVSIGWNGNKETAQTAGFMSNAIFAPATAGTKKAIRDTAVSSDGKWFLDAPGGITVTVAAGGATTEGSFYVFAEYYVIS